ncbi:hypothetical protein G6O67_006129 [Ophiocordyceps sinensis]|uniref:Uncharacterized protein n=2 Tax=Ophiocordyceps sinensis TaxID=72228 RepID=A0A8H4LVA2_9HYPO|nr:hypothetical protein OCS_06125 [Ophiocordyceps sinensis CO18]KAF4506000.1 hypothetical protein G6O67_006129 [Ophiocordyceps sinensis]
MSASGADVPATTPATDGQVATVPAPKKPAQPRRITAPESFSDVTVVSTNIGDGQRLHACQEQGHAPLEGSCVLRPRRSRPYVTAAHEHAHSGHQG